jgi:hypothetical protein
MRRKKDSYRLTREDAALLAEKDSIRAVERSYELITQAIEQAPRDRQAALWAYQYQLNMRCWDTLSHAQKEQKALGESFSSYCRQFLVACFIGSIPNPQKRRKMEQLQWSVIDKEIAKHTHPLGSCVALSAMMYKAVDELVSAWNGTHTGVQSVCQENTTGSVHHKNAKIVPFKSKDTK